jgi:hypothetical protein
MKTIITIILYSILLNTGFAQPIPSDSLYLSQAPPGYTAKIFVLPIVTGTRPMERITITSDGKEIYFSELDSYPAYVQRVKCYKYLNNRWQGPFLVFDGYMGPALSMNDSIMYMQKDVNGGACTYFSVRNSTGWSEPVRRLSTSQVTHYYQESNLKNYYVSTIFSGFSLRDVAILQINGMDTTLKTLGQPINTNMDESDFFIARDESYMIHARHTASLAADLFISYKKTDGSWTNSKSLGPQVNLPSPSWEYGCYVTKDNKYLFFTRGGNALSSYYIYWVRIDNLIDSLIHTNFIPYLKNQIPNQTDTVDHLFNFTVPDSTFIDDDGNNALTYSATLSNGNPLPSWLSFNPATRTFSGTPSALGSIGLKVIATDTANASATCMFTLNIIDHTSIRQHNEQIINEYKLFQNYPNPFNPNTVISYSLVNNSQVSIKIYDILGKEIATLVNSIQNRGVYDITLDMNNLNLSSGIYFYSINVKELYSNKVFEETKVMNYIK